MNNYDKILILHALDKSTNFLSLYENEFKDYYFSFNSEQESINCAKSLLGDLGGKSLIIYLGHGSFQDYMNLMIVIHMKSIS